MNWLDREFNREYILKAQEHPGMKLHLKCLDCGWEWVGEPTEACPHCGKK